jgi:hypothetical protein
VCPGRMAFSHTAWNTIIATRNARLRMAAHYVRK